MKRNQKYSKMHIMIFSNLVRWNMVEVSIALHCTIKEQTYFYSVFLFMFCYFIAVDFKYNWASWVLLTWGQAQNLVLCWLPSSSRYSWYLISLYIRYNVICIYSYMYITIYIWSLHWLIWATNVVSKNIEIDKWKSLEEEGLTFKLMY